MSAFIHSPETSYIVYKRLGGSGSVSVLPQGWTRDTNMYNTSWVAVSAFQLLPDTIHTVYKRLCGSGSLSVQTQGWAGHISV